MAFQLGQTVGDYEFIDIVDSSPNRVAFRVRNHAQDRFELLRVLGAAVQGDQEGAQRFLREASVHKRLVHPNIVPFYSAMTLGGQFVITTELAEGVTLADRLELGPLALASAVSYFDQILAALVCAHEHGVVHRNVSPASVIVTPDDAIKLAGFACARGADDPQLTQVGFPLGDVRYLSPEQVRGTSSLDPRSDIYSAGVVLYEMVAGRRPFDGTSQFDILSAQVTTMPIPPSHLNPALTADCDRIVLRALAKEPSERYQSAAEFRDSLRALAPQAASPAPAPPPASEPAVAAPVEPEILAPPVPVEAAPPPPALQVPRRWLTNLALAMLVVVVFAAFFFMSSHQ